MKYNDVIEVQVVTDASGIEDEPVNLTEAKRHLNLVFDTSGSYAFNDDDTYLTDLITQCREAIEQRIGVTLARKTLRAILRNDCGNIEIPFGPIIDTGDIGELKDENGELIETDDYTIRGNLFKWIETPVSCYIEVNYDAGYDADTIPKALKRAILEEIAFRYNHRGDETNQFAGENIGICKGAMELAAPYSRKSLVA